MRPNKNTLTPSLSVDFAGLIWVLKVHHSGVIAVESRNTELKQVSFSAFNFKTGQIFFKGLNYDETWNLSLAFAGEKNLILSGYEHAETPESKGILSVSVINGSVLWQQFNIALNRVNDHGVEVYDPRFQPRRYYWMNHLSAAKIEAPASDREKISSPIFPATFSSLPIPSFIQHSGLIGEISKVDYNEKVFLSFHEKNIDSIQQRLIVYQDDKVWLDDIMISGIQKLQPEAFFIQQNHLFYIRNKNEIVTYFV